MSPPGRIAAAVGDESFLRVWADWSYFVYLGVFDNLIIVIAAKARPLARRMEWSNAKYQI